MQRRKLATAKQRYKLSIEPTSLQTETVNQIKKQFSNLSTLPLIGFM